MNKKILIYTQILPIILSVLFIVQIFIYRNDYSLIVFNQIGESIYYLLLTIILLYETIFVIIFSLFTKKYDKILLTLIMIPFLITNGILYLLSSVKDYHEITIEEHDETLSIVSHSFLLSGSSYIYEKHNFIVCEKVIEISGDDGYCPLSNPEYYSYEITEDLLIFKYNFDYDKENSLYLKHNGQKYNVLN